MGPVAGPVFTNREHGTWRPGSTAWVVNGPPCTWPTTTGATQPLWVSRWGPAGPQHVGEGLRLHKPRTFLVSVWTAPGGSGLQRHQSVCLSRRWGGGLPRQRAKLPASCMRPCTLQAPRMQTKFADTLGPTGRQSA